jgi:L-threonylcarbamoyladenylate synthase
LDKTKMATPIGTDVDRAARLLRNGKLVAFATETVYGLGANALNVAAVARLFAVKNRPHFDPLIVHIADRAWLPRLVTEWPETAERLSQAFWPGPLTLVLPKSDLVPDLVTSGLPSVAVRMPNHPLAYELLNKADVPVAGPSANLFGELSPTRAEHVAERLGGQIDYILDGGPCSIGLESTVLLLQGRRTTLLRPGGVSLEAIEEVIGPVLLPACSSAHPAEAAPSPGMLPQHYAPRTPLTIVEDLSCVDSPERAGLLTLTATPAASRFAAVEVLSPSGDLTVAAANFFAALRRLDAAGVDRIIATRFPNHGLGRALNDRLMRAATQ